MAPKNTDLQPDQIDRIEQAMRPDQSSDSGFLDPNESLTDVIENDMRTLESTGVTPDQIADRLESLIYQSYRIEELIDRGCPAALRLVEKKGFFRKRKIGIRVEGKFLVNKIQYFGIQECPFEDADGTRCRRGGGSADYSILNKETDLGLGFPALAIHLIRDHDFFEGSVRYRVDPREAIRVLELEPGVTYAPTWKTEELWVGMGGGNVQPGDSLNQDWLIGEKEKEIMDSPDETIQLGEKVTVYRRQDKCVVVVQEYCEHNAPVSIAGALWADQPLYRGVYHLKKWESKYVETSLDREQEQGISES